MSTIRSVVVLGGFLGSFVAAASPAEEAEKGWRGRVFLDFNAGLPADSEGFAYRDSQIIFGEEASAAVAASGRSDAFFDIGGGVRLAGSFGAGVSYSQYDSELDATLDATIPHPFLFGFPGSGALGMVLPRKESGLHVSAVYVIPLHRRLQVGVRGGPTYFRYEQDSIRNFMFRLNPTGLFDFDVEIRDPEIANLSGSTWGYHLAGDVTYLFSDHMGVGALVRYSRGSADVENSLQAARLGGTNTSASLHLGGFQVLAGVRVRF